MTKHSVYKSTIRKSKSSAEAVRVKKEHKNRTSTLQTKLTIGQPNDKYEQEADRIADQVINPEPAQRAGIQNKKAVTDHTGHAKLKPIVQKMEEGEVQTQPILNIMRMEEEEAQPKLQRMPKPDEDLQTKQEKPSSQIAPLGIQSKIQQSKGGGSPLPSSTRSLMESRIGADFGNVRIHNDSNAHKLSTKLNAQAFATGNNIFFNQGKYNPATQSGKHLLAHELTHTVQQGASIKPMIQKQDDESLPPDAEPTGDVFDPESDISRILGAPSYTENVDYSKLELINLQQYIVKLYTEALEASLKAKNVLEVYFPGSGETIYSNCLLGISAFMKIYMNSRHDLTLGEKLLANFPSGVSMAFYGYDAEKDALPAAKNWAKQHQAVSLKSKKATAENIIFGKAISENHKVNEVVPKVAKVLKEAVEAIEKFYGLKLSGGGIGKIKTLALFAHGTSEWCGINFGGSITRSNIAQKMKSVIPALTDDVTVILYACSTVSGPDEAPGWYKGTMQDGKGEDSLGAGVRDLLVKGGKKKASVWGHTETGPSVDNPTLRYFKAEDGTNSGSKSFVYNHAFGDAEIKKVVQEVKTELTKLGYDFSSVNMARFDTRLFTYVQLGYRGYGMYQCVIKANKEERFKGMSIAEAAPLDPTGVGNFLKKYWKDTYWPERKGKFISNIAKKFKLKKP